MISRDNERTLGDALESVKPWVDEIIVVDTGSHDRTCEVALQAGAKVSHYAWHDDFAAARNRSLQAATCEWIFWIDTDDTVPERTGARIRPLLEKVTDPAVLGFVLQVECPGDSRDPTDQTLVDHIKIIRNRSDIRFEGRIHEQVLPSIRRLGGRVEWTDLRVVHSGCDMSAQGRQRKLDRDLRILKLDIQDRPNHPFVLFNLGMTHLHRGECEEAIQSLRQCIGVAHTSESHVRKAYALLVDSLLSARDTANARRACWEGLGRYPNDPELSFKLGRIEMQRMEWHSAVEAFRRVTASGPTKYFSSMDPAIHTYKTQINLAVALEECGETAEAFNTWLSCGCAHPWLGDAWEGVLRLGRSPPCLDAFLRLGMNPSPLPRDGYIGGLCEAVRNHIQNDRENAMRQFAALLSVHGEVPLVLNEYARFLHESGAWEESIPYLHKLQHKDPDNPSVRFNIAHAFYRLGRTADALSHAEQSLAMRPNHAATRQLVAELRQSLSSPAD